MMCRLHIRWEKKYFTIQTAEDGYDYTFYDKDYLELDGGVYDDPTISISEAMENIFEEEGLSVERLQG